MFGIGRDPDLPQVTLWRDFEEPVQLPTGWAGALSETRFSPTRALLVESSPCAEASAVKVLLAHGADPNSVATPYELTPLHIAATPETAELLLKYKAEVDVKDSDGCTPLLHATQNGRHSVVDALIANGAEPNIANHYGTSPLHRAKLAETAELLIAKGAKVDAKNEDNETPLFSATMGNRPSVVEVLIAHGADPNINNEFKSTPLHQARSAGAAELLIQKGAEVNTKNTFGETPLFFATWGNRHSVVEVLLAHGADPNIANHYGTSPLHQARSAGTAELLIAKRAEVNAQDERGKTPLFVATDWNRHSVVEVLLANGADPNIASEVERSPLHQAESAETAELLIQKGAEVNAKDRRGKTPLFVAIENNRHSVVEVLLANGADPNIASEDERSPLHQAESAETAELLIQKGAEVNAQDERGKTPLFVATDWNRHSVVEVLLANGADPNIASEDERSPLHQAVSAETAELLIQKGAEERNDYYSKPSTTSWTELMERRKRWEENRKLQEGGKKSQEGIEKTAEVNPTQRTESQRGHQ
ncbi:unnamed protein product, partial [Cyprideis torosa]